MITKRFLFALAAATVLIPATALGNGFKLTSVPAAMPKVEGMTTPSELSPELVEIAAAQGSMPIENPTSLITHYGFGGDGPMVPAANSAQGKDNHVEATKTEPDRPHAGVRLRHPFPVPGP